MSDTCIISSKIEFKLSIKDKIGFFINDIVEIFAPSVLNIVGFIIMLLYVCGLFLIFSPFIVGTRID